MIGLAERLIELEVGAKSAAGTPRRTKDCRDKGLSKNQKS